MALRAQEGVAGILAKNEGRLQNREMDLHVWE